MYTARGKSLDELLVDYEQHEFDGDYKGATTEYFHAALMVAVAKAQQRWARLVGIAASASAAAAIAAVIVAALR